MNANTQDLAAEDARYWQHAIELPSFRELIAAKKKVLVPMVLIYFGYFMGITLLAGYAKPLMATKVLGSFNVAYLLVLCAYGMCWVMAVIYVRVANRTFDPMAARAVAQLSLPVERA